MPELSPQDAAQGYVLGAHLLAWLAPNAHCAVATVPVSLDAADTATENGIFAYTAVKRQLQAALEILAEYQPGRIVTLGGECSVSVAPFAWLAARYPDDMAVIWLDAHRDLTLPKDRYSGFHAMALSALLGQGDKDIVEMLPARIAPEKALIVGLRTEDDASSRQKALGVASLAPDAVQHGSDTVLAWMKQSGVRKVAVHLDLDVLEPTELKIAVGHDPGGMSISDTIRTLNDIAQEFDLVGLTVAEPMPREVITLRNLLHALPLLR